MRKPHQCKRCGILANDCSIYMFSKDLCEDCHRPHDDAPKPRTVRFKPNTRDAKLKHRFPNEYYQANFDDIIYHFFGDSTRFWLADRDENRKASLRNLLKRCRAGHPTSNDLPF